MRGQGRNVLAVGETTDGEAACISWERDDHDGDDGRATGTPRGSSSSTVVARPPTVGGEHQPPTALPALPAPADAALSPTSTAPPLAVDLVKPEPTDTRAL